MLNHYYWIYQSIFGRLECLPKTAKKLIKPGLLGTASAFLPPFQAKCRSTAFLAAKKGPPNSEGPLASILSAFYFPFVLNLYAIYSILLE